VSDASGELEQAERCFRSCKLLMSDGDTLGAVNRLYYGLYHAARAALTHRDEVHPNAHFQLNGSKWAPLIR
jgi:uncharacterized protein (UPF0332 family)